MNISRQILGWLLLAMMVLLPVGCSKKPANRIPVFPASGKLVDGTTPANGATVFFYPAQGSPAEKLRPIGKVKEDGTFQVSTYVTDDGAPEGEYTLTVVWPKDPSFDDSPDRLGGRCNNLKKSKWHVRVEPSKANDIGTFDLKTWATGVNIKK